MAKQNHAGKGFWNYIYKLSLVASVYFLWGERNFKIFQGRSRDFDAIRVRLSSWTIVKFTTQNRGLCDDWLLDS
ncbi:hypothetical protein RHMOL_Rhmol08G0191500 [Rhododendron molle]|uniref:Uncharacterized protein n=1 Tax=Rhododendron molle TaxID=49168 RepID=A0ACC0MRF3_RHOML|nr:hypothetical protein RHMOL_Rhmol08G0191500 [Rhododendron molle]